jgi:hypothetical protein
MPKTSARCAVLVACAIGPRPSSRPSRLLVPGEEAARLAAASGGSGGLTAPNIRRPYSSPAAVESRHGHRGTKRPITPPGAERRDGWETHDGKTFRYFEGNTRGDAAEVKIGGFQNADGTISDVVLHVDAQEGLDPAGTQELINNLIAAQEEARRLTSS